MISPEEHQIIGADNTQTCNYRKISNIRRTKPPNLNVPRLVLQLYLAKLLMPGIKPGMKM